MTYTYNPDDKFGVKDTLNEGHPEKKILGVEFDQEFLKISTAIETINLDIGDLINNSGFPEPPEGDEVWGRTYKDPDPDDASRQPVGAWVETPTKAEFTELKDQVNSIDPDGDSSVEWDEITDKPTEFPPEVHGHEIAEINGLSDALTDAGAPTSWDDVTGKPAEFPPSDHSHVVADIADFDPADYQPAGDYATEQYVDDSIALETQARIDGDAALQASIDAISGGTSAPVDSVNGKTGVVVLSAADVGALPNTYDPGINYPVTSVNGKTGAVTLTHTDVGAQVAGSYAADNHNHTGVYQPAGSYAAADHTHTYDSLTGKPTLYTGADAVKTSGDQTIAGIKTFSEDIRGKKNVISYYSDIRLKDIQGPIENPVEKVKAIETFYYTHGDRARELGYEGSEIQVGVSAQSVQAVAPELIHRAPVDDDGEGGSVTGESYITVDYPRLVPLLIESIKQLSAEIEELKK